MKTKMLGIFLTLLCLGILLWGVEAQGRVKLVTIPVRENVVISIDWADQPLVQEDRVVNLRDGINLVDFSWANTNINPVTINIEAMTEPEKVSILNVSYPGGKGNSLIWEVDSIKDGPEQFRITYVAQGLRWIAMYRAMADVEQRQLTLEQDVRFYNNTGEEYRDAEIILVAGGPHTLSLRNGETKQLNFFEIEGIPFEVKYAWQLGKNDNKTKVLYIFKNDVASNLGKEILLSGKARIFKKDITGSFAFIGEDMMDFTPVGDEVSLFAGSTRDILVHRTRTEYQETNIRRRTYDNEISCYDLIQTYQITVENHKQEDIEIKITEVVADDYWEMLSSSHDYTKLNASTIEYVLQVPADGKVVVSYRFQRKNITPGA